MSQPTPTDAFTSSSNPVSKDPSETTQSFNASDSAAHTSSQPVPRTQATHEQGLQNAKYGQGTGIHGAPAGEEAKGLTEEDVGRHNELDGAQMAAPGEGEMAEKVRKGGMGLGGGGEEPDLASDLDRKKAEQAEARNAIKGAKGENTSVGGALGQSGGPLSTVD